MRLLRAFTNLKLHSSLMSSLSQVGSTHRLSPSPEQPKTKKPRLEKKQFKKRRGKPEIEACSPEDVLWHDVVSLLGSEHKIGDVSPPYDKQDIAELEISALTSDGTVRLTRVLHFTVSNL